jgi:fatty acid desaturase
MSTDTLISVSGRGSPKTRLARIDWRTVVLAVVIYGAWFMATLLHRDLPWPARIAVGGWLIAWHGSLQHETIHGHPTPWRRINTLIGVAPLALWLPYERYRATHLAHHATDRVTEPGVDPESRYLMAPGGRLNALNHAVGRLQATLFGRLSIGPFVEAARFLSAEAAALARGEGVGPWVRHGLAVAVTIAWLRLVCRFSLADYLLTFVYPGMALTLIRSYAEHRAHRFPEHRVAVVERAPVLGLLFLNNNLHAVHHRHPSTPWHRLPELYRRTRADVLKANGGLVYAGYGEVFARFLTRPHDDLVHPRVATDGWETVG